MLGIQNNVSIRPSNLPAELIVGHGHSALGPLGASGGHAPAQLGNRAVEIVLRENHVTHQSERDARHVLTVSPERHVLKVRMRMRARRIIQAMRAKPVATTNAGRRGFLKDALPRHHRRLMGGILGVELHHATAAHLEDVDIDPAAIPQLDDAYLVGFAAIPSLLLRRPGAVDVGAWLKTGTQAAFDDITAVATHAAGRVGAIDQLLEFRESRLGTRLLDELLAQQPTGIAQIGLLGAHVPINLVAMHIAAALVVAERVIRPGHLNPAETDAALRPEGGTHRLVGLGMSLGLIQPVVQRIGHILALRIAIRRHAPIGARLGLVAANSRNCRADHVFLGRRNAKLFQLLQQPGIQLIAIDVIRLGVGL